MGEHDGNLLFFFSLFAQMSYFKPLFNRVGGILGLGYGGVRWGGVAVGPVIVDIVTGFPHRRRIVGSTG